MDKIKAKIEYMLEKNQDKVVELITHMYKHDPQAVERMLDYPKDADHITNRGKYEELVEKIKWAEGGKRGAKWGLDDIKRYAEIDFDNAEFTIYDYAYLVNMLYAKCCKYFKDASTYLKLAKCLIEDDDEETKLYKGAYADKKHHKQHGEQSYYNEYDRYDEEDRRGRKRHYRNTLDEYNDDRFDNYDEENRRRYRSEYDRYPENNSYYKESNMVLEDK